MIPVHLSCPACGYTWLEALIDPQAWWAKGVTPASCARIPYYPQYEAKPPMRVVSGQIELLSDAHSL